MQHDTLDKMIVVNDGGDMTKYKGVMIYLNEEDQKNLKLIAKKSEIPVSAMLRLIVKQIISQSKQ